MGTNCTAPGGERLHLFYGGPFSNWVTSPFEMEGAKFFCAEQAFMWHKARIFGDEAAMNTIEAEDDPFEIKAVGRSVRGFQQRMWDARKYELMADACRHKFLQNPPLLAALKATRGRTIVEASPTDRVWGIGWAEDHPYARQPKRWRGENLLGRVLTELRIDIVGE